MDRINELSTGEKLVVGGGIVLLIASFLPWYDIDILGVSFSRSGWQSPGAIWSVFATLIGVVMAGSILATGSITMALILRTRGGR